MALGDTVLVKSKWSTTASSGGGEPRRGKVKRLRSNGTIDVYYDNGEIEEGVGRERIRSVTSATASDASGREQKKTSSTASKRTAASTSSANVRQQSSATAAAAATVTPPPPVNTTRATGGPREENVPLFSPPAVAVTMDTSVPPRRIKTAEAVMERSTSNTAATTTNVRRSSASDRQSMGRTIAKYVDMSEALQENQRQVTHLLSVISDQREDPTAVKNALSSLLRVVRSAPQVTAECLHQQQGEALLYDIIESHASHAVLLCYGCVLLRKLCHLSIEATEMFVQRGVIELLAQILRRFLEDAILQASACGCLSALAQLSNPTKNKMLDTDCGILQLVLESLTTHREYSNLTRQVQIYACEVLVELCDYGGGPTATLVVGNICQEISTIELLVSLLRQSIAREDRKVICIFCTLLLCLAANSTLGADSLRELGAMADISLIMAKFPVDEGIVRFSAPALRAIAATSMQHSPSRRVIQTARVILDEEILRPTPHASATARSTSPGRAGHSGRVRDISRDTPPSSSRTSSRPQTAMRVSESTGSMQPFGQAASALGSTPSMPYFTSTPSELQSIARESSRMASQTTSRIPLPRSREQHIKSGATPSKKKVVRSSLDRDKKLIKTYGGGKQQHKSLIPSAIPIPVLHDPARVNPLRNNFFLESNDAPFASGFPTDPPLAKSRAHSAKLAPLSGETIKFSTTRYPDTCFDPMTADARREADSSASRPQTAVVVTKVPEAQRKSHQRETEGKAQRGRMEAKKSREHRDGGAHATVSQAQTLYINSRPTSRSISPVRGKRSTSKSRSPRSNRAMDVPGPTSLGLAATEMTQSLQDLQEIAQQLLREEQRIANLSVRPSSNPISPGQGRMSFSDKLHKMIEIAETSMYERGLNDASAEQQSTIQPQLGRPVPSEAKRSPPKANPTGYKVLRSSGSKAKLQTVQQDGQSVTKLPDLNTRVPFSFDAVNQSIISPRTSTTEGSGTARRNVRDHNDSAELPTLLSPIALAPAKTMFAIVPEESLPVVHPAEQNERMLQFNQAQPIPSQQPKLTAPVPSQSKLTEPEEPSVTTEPAVEAPEEP
ncbi:TPA: hypothetical protein N0F65_007969, partial [Lagenidium giganteum]